MATDGLRGSSGALAEVVPRSAGILGGRRRDRRGRGAGPAKKSAGAVRVREVTYGADEHARPSRPLAGSVAAGRWPVDERTRSDEGADERRTDGGVGGRRDPRDVVGDEPAERWRWRWRSWSRPRPGARRRRYAKRLSAENEEASKEGRQGERKAKRYVPIER